DLPGHARRSRPQPADRQLRSRHHAAGLGAGLSLRLRAARAHRDADGEQLMAPRLTATASQTIGPYWHLIEHAAMPDLPRLRATGEAITVTGTITDGAGGPVADAAVEIWQPSPQANDSFPGFGRARTDATGRFTFRTLKPGPVPGSRFRGGNAQ